MMEMNCQVAFWVTMRKIKKLNEENISDKKISIEKVYLILNYKIIVIFSYKNKFHNYFLMIFTIHIFHRM